MSNKQIFENIGNPNVIVNTSDGSSEKQTDPMQLIAFDTMKKINRVFIAIILLGLINLCILGVIFTETISTRQQYDKLRHTVNDFKEQVEIMQNTLQK